MKPRDLVASSSKISLGENFADTGLKIDRRETLKWVRKTKDDTHRVAKLGDSRYLFNRQDECCFISSEEIDLISSSGKDSYTLKPGIEIDEIKSLLSVTPQIQSPGDRPIVIFPLRNFRLVVYTRKRSLMKIWLFDIGERFEATSFRAIRNEHKSGELRSCGTGG